MFIKGLINAGLCIKQRIMHDRGLMQAMHEGAARVHLAIALTPGVFYFVESDSTVLQCAANVTHMIAQYSKLYNNYCTQFPHYSTYDVTTTFGNFSASDFHFGHSEDFGITGEFSAFERFFEQFVLQDVLIFN